MKTIIMLSALAILSTSCSKSPRSKSPVLGGGTPGTTTNPSTPGESLPPMNPGQDQDQSQDDQTQNNGSGISTSYSGSNVTLKFPSAKAEGKIIIRDQDAARLFKRLAIKEEKRGEGKSKISFKVAKHVECSSEECVLNINYRDGGVVANSEEKIGKHKGKFLPSLLTYNGDNLRIVGTKKDAYITLSGNDAKALYKAMSMGATSSYEGEKILDTKVGVGDAPITCVKEKAASEADDSFSCSVKLHAANGIVEIP